MTQIMQPDVGEPGLPFHFLPNPIQPDPAASSPRKHKLTAIWIQTEKYLSDGHWHFDDTRSGFRIAQANFSRREINAVPAQRFNFGPTGTSQDQYSDCGDPIDRICLFVLKCRKNLINVRAYSESFRNLSRAGFFEMLNFCEWIDSIRHFLEQICISVKPAPHSEHSICERTPVSK